MHLKRSEKTSDAPGTAVKLLYTSEAIIIDVPWDQDDPNDKNQHNGAIQCDLGQCGQLENKKNVIARIVTV